jgi:2-methylcitrate dehydratase PrpD
MNDSPASDFDPTVSLSAGLIELIHAKPVTDTDLRQTAQFALDAIANILGGATDPHSQAVTDWVRDEPVTTARRAFVLGAYSTVLEMDAMHRKSAVHAGTTVVPTVLAMTHGSKQGGRAILSALLRGAEAALRIGAAAGPAHYKMYQNSSTCGAFGSAFAASLLLSLSKQQTLHALGNAGTRTGGLWQYRENGAMTKQVHAGGAAETGIVAAQLASRGMTGPVQILEGGKGFFRAMCPDADPTAVLRDPRAPWSLLESSIKPWPSSRHTHPAIDAALGVHAQLGGRRVEQIDVQTYQTAVDLCNRAKINTPHEGKSSIQYCVAAALHEGRVRIDSFAPDIFPQVIELARRVRVVVAEPFGSAYPGSWGASVSARLSDGTLLGSERKDCKGDPEAPMSEDELKDKARSLMTLGGVSNAEKLTNAILAMADDQPAPTLQFAF